MSVFDNYECAGQISIFDILNPDTLCGKTSPELSVQTKAKTSDVSLKKFAELRIKPPMYLCLKKESGVQADVSWVTGGALLGEYTMRSFGECPKEENVSRLSQILEVNPPEKYCLSARACQGILNRALKRGKKLPEQLRIALIRQSAFKNEQDAQGGGKGILIQNEKTASIRTQNNQSVCYGMDNVPVVIEGNGSRESHRGDGYKESEISYTLNSTEVHGVCHEEPTCIQRRFSNVNLFENGITPTLEAGAGEGGNNMPMVCYGLDRASFNQGQNAQYDFSVEEEKAQTLVSRGPGGY